MAIGHESLWPDDLSIDEPIQTPVGILREQAELLTQKTEGLVIASVTRTKYATYDGRPRDLLSFTLVLRVPALDDYRYRLLRIDQSIALYPVSITMLYTDSFSTECTDEAEFVSSLRGILHSQKVREVLVSLIAHAKEAMDE